MIDHRGRESEYLWKKKRFDEVQVCNEVFNSNSKFFLFKLDGVHSYIGKKQF